MERFQNVLQGEKFVVKKKQKEIKPESEPTPIHATREGKRQAINFVFEEKQKAKKVAKDTLKEAFKKLNESSVLLHDESTQRSSKFDISKSL